MEYPILCALAAIGAAYPFATAFLLTPTPQTLFLACSLHYNVEPLAAMALIMVDDDNLITALLLVAALLGYGWLFILLKSDDPRILLCYAATYQLAGARGLVSLHAILDNLIGKGCDDVKDHEPLRLFEKLVGAWELALPAPAPADVDLLQDA